MNNKTVIELGFRIIYEELWRSRTNNTLLDLHNQGRNEIYEIRDHRAGIWDHKPWDRDQ